MWTILGLALSTAVALLLLPIRTSAQPQTAPMTSDCMSMMGWMGWPMMLSMGLFWVLLLILMVLTILLLIKQLRT
jgi:hypothetical protein